MDLQKEREAFEVLQNPKILQRAEFLVNISAYAVINAYRDDLFTLEWVEELNFGWRMWKAAKAQAVPEDFVLVPREPTDAMIEAGYQHCEPNGILPHSFYEAMIEAAEKEMIREQEQSHECF